MEWLDKLNAKQRAAANKVAAAADKHSVPRELALAAAMQESTFDQRKKSGTGPLGVMMMGRAASKQYGINPHNEDQNIEGGVRYLGDLLKKHGGDPQKALIAYHDGPNSPYFKGGQMSPAAYNHLQKVQSYGGFQGDIIPMAKEVPFKIAEVEPIEDISFPPDNSEDIKFFARPRDIVDYGAGATGALAGAAFGSNRPLSVNKQRLELGKQRVAMSQLNQAQASMPPTAKTFGQDIGNWVPGQYREDIARNIQSPMSQEDAAAQARALEAKANVANAKFGPTQPARQGSPIVIPGNMPQFPGSAVTAPPPVAQPTLADMPASKIGAGRNLPGRAMNTGTGALAGMQAADAYQRAMQGDTAGAALSGISSAGLAGATHIPNRKAQLAAGVVGAGAGLLGQGYDYLRDKFDIKRKPESVLEKAAGGLTALPKFAGRGESLVKLGKAALSKGEEMIGRSSPEMFMPRPTKIMPFSEALAPHEGKYLGLTQTDNFGVHGGRMGGNQFPNFQNISPAHREARAAWMNDTEKHANDLVKNRRFNDKDVVYSTYIGGPDQLKSNKTVHSHILDEHYKRELTPEQIDLINNRIATVKDSKGRMIFSTPFDIRDRFAAQELGGDTFARRSALSSMLGEGEGVGRTKQGIAMPNYQDILRSHRDPLTEGVPTSSVGTRLFTVDDAPAQYREDLHPDYRWLVRGEDQGVQFNPVPQHLAVPDWYQQYKARFPNKEPHGNAWFSYPKTPQFIDEKYLTNLQKNNYDKGGVVKPIVDRINMHFKDVTKRIPQLQEAAQKLQGGEMSREAYEQLVNTHKPVTPFGFIPKPATREEAMNALTSDKKEMFGVPSKTLPAGHPVGLRLDIPAYSNHGVWVPTVHEQASGFGAGKSIGHESVAHVLNPQFGMSDKAALSIASGKPKGTIATIKGNWNPTDEQAAVAKAQEYLNHPEWRQVGMDPERHGYFYDRATMEPITHAEEALQIGPLVLAKKPVYGKKEDFKFAKGGLTHLS